MADMHDIDWDDAPTDAISPPPPPVPAPSPPPPVLAPSPPSPVVVDLKENEESQPDVKESPVTSSAVLLQGFQSGMGTLISYTGNPVTTFNQIQDMSSDAVEIGGVFLDVNSTVTEKVTSVFLKTMLKGKTPRR